MTLPPSRFPRPLASLGRASSEYSEIDSRTNFGFSSFIAFGADSCAHKRWRAARAGGGRSAVAGTLRLGRIIERSVRERPMISLERVEDPDRGPVVPRDAEANGVGSPVLREVRATDRAHIRDCSGRRRVCSSGCGARVVGAAKSRIKVAQAATRSGQALARIEIRTGHGRYSSIRR